MLRDVLPAVIVLCACTPALAQTVHKTDESDPTLTDRFPPASALQRRLSGRGLSLGAVYIGEVFGNMSGGRERGAIFDGRFELAVDADLAQFLGLSGLTFHAHGYQIHGESITDKVGNLNPVSNIEAAPATRLMDLWFQQTLWDDKVSMRLGQITVDSEFMAADSAGSFISSAFGWPTIAAVNLPNGGVAYPLSSPGFRIEYAATDRFKVRAGAYNDDPSGPCRVDAQLCNRRGLDFRVKDEPFVIGEVELGYGGGFGGPLPGVIKLGAWKDYGDFEDQRFDRNGLSLADPASDGSGRSIEGNHGYYAVLDQQLWEGPGGGIVSMFLRTMGAPGDRNLVDLSIDGGLVFAGLVNGRPNDSFGIAAALAGISGAARGLDRDARALGSDGPIHADEIILELVYTAEVTPGWIVQPDFQYVWRPGGHAADESGTGPLQDAAVLGVRSTLNF